jgi:protoheme IX farnesyltransferase
VWGQLRYLLARFARCFSADDRLGSGNQPLQFGTRYSVFAIQFFWQFPHFWAIAWVADLMIIKKQEFRLLPSSGGKDERTALQIMIYTLFLLPVGWLPYELGMTGINSALVAMVCGISIFWRRRSHLMRKLYGQSGLADYVWIAPVFA